MMQTYRLDKYVTRHEKTGLMYTNTPTHVTVRISFTVYDFRSLQAA